MVSPEDKVMAAKASGPWALFGFGQFLNSIGINSWADASYAAGFFLSCLLIGDFFWKKFKKRKDKDDGS